MRSRGSTSNHGSPVAPPHAAVIVTLIDSGVVPPSDTNGATTGPIANDDIPSSCSVILREFAGRLL